MLSRALQVLSAVAILSLQHCSAQDFDFTLGPIPDPFELGDFYPARDEEDVCRPIRDHIRRGSARFNSELLTNTNPNIDFADSDSRIMTSRMQSRLDRLAQLYWQQHGRRFTVLMAYAEFPDTDLIGDDGSLHYEGRTVQIGGVPSNLVSSFLTLGVQAAFDWVFYADPSYVRLSVIPDSCQARVDMVFMLDQSGSVGRSNHNIAIQFIINVVSFFNIGLDSTRVGLVAYSTDSHIEFDLNDHTDLQSLQNAIDNVNYRGGFTATALALDDTRELLNPSNNRGTRPDSEGIPRIAILITDGKSNEHPIDLAAPALKNAGVLVYTVGIGNIDIDELQFISSDPDQQHVFLLNSFNDAAGFVDFLSVTTCETPALIDSCVNTTTDVQEDVIRYFQTACSQFSSSVTVELTDMQGRSFLYCSTTETNPGPLTIDTVSDETSSSSIRTCTVDASGGVLYIGVQGQQTNNVFNMIVLDSLFTQPEENVNAIEGEQFDYDVSQNLNPASSGTTLQYNIVSGNIGNTFSINQNTGVLRVDQSLNFDMTPFYSLEIVARNAAASCHCARFKVNVVVVRNRIDFVPVEDQRVDEDAPMGQDIVQIQATGGAGTIQYSLDGTSPFAIDQMTGQITLEGTLDFETQDEYTLTVRADSSVGASVTDTTSVRIIVDDVNEQPHFTTTCAVNNRCSPSIDENQPGGTSIRRVRASDPDLSTVANGMLTFSFSSPSVPFRVDSNGRIFTTESLDREDQDTYSLTLIVVDGGSPPLSIQTTIQITVEDLNDNSPVFINGPDEVSVAEDAPSGFVVTQYVAEDDDQGSNAEITFSLSSQSTVPFTIDSDNGALMVSDMLDFETTTSYTVTVTASNTDGSGQEASVTTLIRVVDVNDNSPVFQPDTYSADVVEHSIITTSVVTVSATDEDSGSNGDIRYAITSGNVQASFSIDALSGEITVAEDIDRETITSFILQVTARDQGSPQRSSFATVSITVLDINDNTPQFTDTYQRQLREDTQPGFVVFTLLAVDRDQPNTDNSRIIYSIDSGNVNSTFTLNGNTGQLELASPLDFETRSQYILTVHATDQGTSPLTGVATVTIDVTNVNEDPPVLSGVATVNISELAPVSTQVAQIMAVDPDSMNTPVITIESGNIANTFTISNGIVSLAQPLDFETTPVYVLVIEATDGMLSATTNLTVIVIDENEFAPEFFGSTNFEVEEEMLAGTLVGTVQATDGDGSAPNNEISFSFLPDPLISQYFGLNLMTGEIRTLLRLDREQLTQVFSPPDSMRTVDVSARDGGSPALQTIEAFSITLLDVNDNPPVFADPEYENSFLENLPAGTLVFDVSATDIDLGSNAEITFSFEFINSVNGDNPFQIDNGLITTTTTLDCEVQQQYNFTITATDGGSPAQNSTVSGVLTLLDENDNPPIFSMLEYHITVNESLTPVENVVLQVNATDRDKGENGRVTYTIFGQSAGEVFENQGVEATVLRINAVSGEIRHTTAFDFETQPMLNLTVVATDNGVPVRSASASVFITVVNADESAPEFPQPCIVSIPEDLSIGSEVITCVAFDVDNITQPGEDGIFYSLEGSGSDVFEVERTTGVITLANSLDFNLVQVYDLRLVASDLAGRRTPHSVRISVTDVNDNTPVFSGSPYQFQFTDSNIRNYVREIDFVQADDLDDGLNGEIVYSVSVDSQTDTQAVLTIVASDQGTPQQSASAMLTITYDNPCLLHKYSIDPSSGVVFVDALCQIAIAPSAENVTLGGTHTIRCNVVRNSQTTYEFLQDGRIVTPPVVLPQSDEAAVFTISQASFEDAGDYACKVTTAAGILQTTTSSVTIHVPPEITVPPVNVAVETGSSAEFTCVATGIPAPSLRWLRGDNEVETGRTLAISSVGENDQGTYTCEASNSAGVATSSATLTAFVPDDNVVEVTLSDINNPSEDGSCHYFNAQEFEDRLTEITGQTTMVTDVSSDNLCDQNACMPNPCQNRGECLLNENIAGGYECACGTGFSGRNCERNVNECVDGPCGNRGTCQDTFGLFFCDCSSGFSGHRCQFSDACSDPAACSPGQTCVESLTSSQGFLCTDTSDPNNFLVLTVTLSGLDPGFLEDLVRVFSETLQQAAQANNLRRKRQTDPVDPGLINCEPHFFSINSTHLALFWECPNGISPPTSETESQLCEFLLESGPTDSCQPPGGEPVTPPPPLPDTEITVTLIMVDEETNMPLDAEEAAENLDETDALDEAAGDIGANVESVTLFNGTDTPTPPAEEPSGGEDSIGIIVGAVVGAVVLVAIIVIVIVAIMCLWGKYGEHKKKQNQKRQHAHAMQLSALENQQPHAYVHPVLKPTESTANLVDNDADDYDELPPRLPPKPYQSNIHQEENIYANV